MASTTMVRPAWVESIHFDVYQAKLAAATGDFTYFQASRSEWNAKRKALLEANDIDPVVMKKLGEIDIASALANSNAMSDLKNSLETTDIPVDIPVSLQEQAWVKAIQRQNELAKKEVTDRMDAAANEAIFVIGQLPEQSQGVAAGAYQVGVDLVMLAFKYLADKIKENYNYITDFLSKNWVSLVNTSNAVKEVVHNTVDEIEKFFGLEDRKLAHAKGTIEVNSKCGSIPSDPEAHYRHLHRPRRFSGSKAFAQPSL